MEITRNKFSYKAEHSFIVSLPSYLTCILIEYHSSSFVGLWHWIQYYRKKGVEYSSVQISKNAVYTAWLRCCHATCPSIAILFADISTIVQKYSSTLQVVKGHSEMQRSPTPRVYHLHVHLRNNKQCYFLLRHCAQLERGMKETVEVRQCDGERSDKR